MNRDRELICGGFSVLLSALVFALCLRIPFISEAISARGNLNMLLYAGVLVLFVLTYLLSMFATRNWAVQAPAVLESPRFKKTLACLLFLLTSLFLIVMMFMETGQASTASGRYAWHTMPELLALLLFIVAFLIFLMLVASIGKVRFADVDQWIWLIFLLLACLIFWSMYTVNLFGRGEWTDWYHGYAYYNSVYNVLHGVPYSGEVTSIYGHYALFFLLPMKLLGGSMRAFILLQALLSAFASLLAFATLKMLVKNRLLQVLGAIAISFVLLGMRAGYYWQVWPHRILFPVILLFYVTLTLKKGKLNFLTGLIAYIICTLAIIWNTETGLVLALSLAVLRISLAFADPKKGILARGVRILFQIGGVAVSFAGAYLLVNLYNLLCGGTRNTIREFLIPLTSSDYVTDILHLDLPLYPSAYMVELLLFAMGVVLGLAEWRCFHRKDAEVTVTWQNQLILFLSVSALGRLIYYMNRPAYHNLDCCHYSAVILLAYFAQYVMQSLGTKRLARLNEGTFSEMSRGMISFFCLAAVFFMAIGTVVQYGENNYLKEGYRDTDSLQTYLADFAAAVPENTFAFGMNVPLLYSYLHWDTGYYGMDYSDISVIPGEAARTIEAIKNEEPEALVTSATTLPSLEKFDPEGYAWFCENYEQAANFDLTDEAFLYYTKVSGK